MSISEMVANDGVDQILDEKNCDSMQFNTLSNASGVKSKSSPVNSKHLSSPPALQSSSYHEKSQNSNKSKNDTRKKKKGKGTPASNQKFESASLDMSDTSSKKYW